VVLAVNLTHYAFFDEAGKWHDKDFICLCGYLSDGTNWDSFTRRWRDLLAVHELSAVHLATFGHQAKLKGWDETKANSVLSEFCKIIRDHILIGFAVGMDTKHYRAIPKDRKKGMPKPDTACLQRLLRLIRNRLHKEQYNGRISVTLDEEEGQVIHLYGEILRLRRANPDLGRYIGAACFADDEFIPPLQAADVIAGLTYLWFKERMAGTANASEPLEPLKSLLVSPETGLGLDYEDELWDADALDAGLDKLLEGAVTL
jgi:hypothetical protein